MDMIVLEDGPTILSAHWTLFLFIGGAGAVLVAWRRWAAWPAAALWWCAAAEVLATARSLAGTEHASAFATSAAVAAFAGLSLQTLGFCFGSNEPVWLRLKRGARRETAVARIP
jgi:hypothetical protein